MANSALLNDVVMEENIVVENAQGTVEPMPVPPPAFAAASSDDTIGHVAIGVRPDGSPTRLVNAMKLAGSFTATVSAPGLTDWVETFDIGPDNAPALVAGDASSITTVPQPLPLS